jgi:hypothetical protein
MSPRGDTLVLKVVETNTNKGSPEQNRTYILYDQQQQTFLIRGGYSVKYKLSDYSFYCDYVENLKDMLKIFYNTFDELGVSLVNFKNLPTTSDDITFSLLLDEDCKANEIVGYDYKQSIGDNWENVPVDRYLNVLRNVYNDY